MQPKYVHEVWQLTRGKGTPWRKLCVIKTKKAFKKWAIDHFFMGDPEQIRHRIGFRLVGSPNTTLYEILPYINRGGNKSVAFAPRGE